MPTETVAYPPLLRALTATLVVISRAGALILLVLLLFFETPLGNPLRLMRAFSAACLLPSFIAWLIQRACRATLSIADGTLVLEQYSRRMEIPLASIAAITPWRAPLPSPGVWLRLRSGRQFRYGLQINDSIALAEAIKAAGTPEELPTPPASWMAAYYRAKDYCRRWYRPILKFVVFALVPTLPLFRLHQWIAYGGTFGEYYTYGLEAYLLGFAIYWATLTIYLVLYAAALRVAGEITAVIATYLSPSRAGTIRRTVEITHRALYYGGVPALLAWRFLSS